MKMIAGMAADEHRVTCKACGKPYICGCDRTPKCVALCEKCGS